MKNIIRAFVVALTLTGAVASAYTPSVDSSKQIATAKVSAYPIPVCPPDDPNACQGASSK